MNLSAQLPALLGVLVGACITYAFGTLLKDLDGDENSPFAGMSAA
jgi:hypothetical protein